jgi:hypothetical protein
MPADPTDVRFGSKADSLGVLAKRPLLGVKQTFPAMVLLMRVYEYTP